MALPLFDPIQIPPDTVLVDVNTLEDVEEREMLQALALAAWVEDQGLSWDAVTARDWDDNEGIFAVQENGVTIGVAVVFDVEAI